MSRATLKGLDGDIDALLRQPAGSLSPIDKRALLERGIRSLTAHHRAHCAPYARLLDRRWPAPATALEDQPWLPVGLFKSHYLASVPDDQIVRELRSSGTSGQQPSRILLDSPTARLQTRGLAHCMKPVLGERRLPMLIVDRQDLFSDPVAVSARGAGVLGMMTFGRDHLYLLDEDHNLRRDALDTWLSEHGDAPFLVFGFTFMIWAHLLSQAAGVDLSRGRLVHGGGWKALVAQQVDRQTFKRRIRDRLGITAVHDFYGMVEQIGGVFVEEQQQEGEEAGLLSTPDFAEIIIRDPSTWRPLPPGEVGLIQVLSLLPHSYPGHSLLTEDLGRIHHIGPRGTRFSVIGRAPTAELRGCSDVLAAGAR